MKKFREYIGEDLNLALQEPSQGAAEQAKKLGLQYVGFGRYEDPRTQQITHIVKNDKLIPYKSSAKTNTFKQTQQVTNDYTSQAEVLSQNTEMTKQALVDHYSPENYTPDELDAVQSFTGGQYQDINTSVSSLPSGTSVKNSEIPLNGSTDNIAQTISNLDSAVNKVVSPIDFIAYVGLGPNTDIKNFVPGAQFSFKGYRSVTLDMNLALDYSNKSPKSLTRDQTVLLQIKVPKGSKGMYVDDYSANPGESEYILPRGTMIAVDAGPKKLVGADDRAMRGSLEVLYFDCSVVVL